MKVKSKLSVFQKRRTTKCNPRTVTPVSAVCAVFRTQPNAYTPKAWKPDVVPLWSSIAGTANAEEGLATSRQIDSKTSITRSAAEYKLLTWCRCPFGRWLFFAIEKIFKTGCSKRGFLSDQIEGLFEKAAGESEVNILWTFVKRGLKRAFSLPTTWETFSEGFEQATQARKCKWFVNFLERASKNRVPVAYAVRGLFSRDTAQNAKFCRIK